MYTYIATPVVGLEWGIGPTFRYVYCWLRPLGVRVTWVVCDAVEVSICALLLQQILTLEVPTCCL